MTTADVQAEISRCALKLKDLPPDTPEHQYYSDVIAEMEASLPKKKLSLTYAQDATCESCQ